MSVFAGSSHNCRDARHNFIQAKWLSHIVIAADSEPRDLILGVIARGQEQNRDFNAHSSDFFGDTEPGNIWKHHVEQHYVGLGVGDHVDRVSSVSRSGNLVPGETKTC